MEMFETAAQFLAFVVVVGILIAGVAVMLINIIKSVCKKNAIIDDSIFEKVSEKSYRFFTYLQLIEEKINSVKRKHKLNNKGGANLRPPPVGLSP